MIRKIIHIDEAKCNGCGLCVEACNEGAIALIDGKARLVREDYCDGLGNCLPACPEDAISFEEREAPAFSLGETQPPAHRHHGHDAAPHHHHHGGEATLACGCPGSSVRALPKKAAAATEKTAGGALSQWPVQIKLLPLTAPFYHGADLLIAADCCAYAYAAFHRDFISGKITLVGCPKLDDVDYSEKLTEIFANNHIHSVTLTRMEVPCCGGMAKAVKTAIEKSGKKLPLTIYTISAQGEIIAKEDF